VIPLKTNLREKQLELQIKDTWYHEVSKSLREDEMRVPKYEECSLDNDGLLQFRGRIYVPQNEDIRQLILNEAHLTIYIAHPGVKKMSVDLKPLLFWKGMKNEIMNLVAKCLEC